MRPKQWWAEKGESWKTGSAAKDERMDAYLEWELTPPDERDPETKTELAEVLDCTIQTLRNYRVDPSFQRRYASRASSVNRIVSLPDVMAALLHQAKDTSNPRSVQAAKVWLDATERFMDANKPDFDPKTASDEELSDVVVSLLKSIEERGA